MKSNSENPYADLVVELRPDITFSNRNNGSGLCYLIEDLASKRFYTIGESEYRFLCLLDGRVTLGQAYDRYRESFSNENRESIPVSQQYGAPPPTKTLDFRKVVQLFEFLSAEKLVHAVNGRVCPRPEPENDSGSLIGNVNPMGFKLRLFDPDPVADKLAAKVGWLFGPLACAVWLLTVGWAFVLFLNHQSDLFEATRIVVQPENWIWLAVSWIGLKVIHEASHAVCCKVFGGTVGEAGVNFLLLLPMPYVDVSSSWRFDSRWHRIYVALAGIYAELLVASIFLLVWAFTDNPVLDNLSVQIILMASLTTVLFNANPLMRFDGYFVLSDLLKRPNLATNGARYQKAWVKRLLFGIPPREDLGSFDLITRIYGWLAAGWRVMVAVGLIFGAAHLFHGAGIVLAGLAVVFWYVRPALLFFKNSILTPGPYQASQARCFVSFCGVCCLVLLSTWTPWPLAPYGHGVVDFADQQIIRAPASGFIEKIRVTDGQHVTQGQVLAELTNSDLEYNLKSLKIDREIATLNARRLKRERKLAEFQAEKEKILQLEQQIEILAAQADKLQLVAPFDGFVLAQNLPDRLGAFCEQGDEIMRVVSNHSVEVVSCVNTFDAPLFRKSLDGEVIVAFDTGTSIRTRLASVEPGATVEIVHPALSARHGGPLVVHAVEHEDQQQRTELVSPVFKFKTAPLRRYADDDNPLLVGQRCRVFLAGKSHSCFQAIYHGLRDWLRKKWQATDNRN